ncbi:acetyl-CoA carboxylase biotin carboxylase subunit [Persicobacter psychrovividus]|uniref:3-methylcrotonyl-CoA carboxylase subunit alpha n=1 Tax=Persicobacter psychrovividus TaxID=387638 RepID=A0ABM7VGA4_9BACT|nr:3-methylcrotonyl-CoA carboxylase subunit alpha [Persicobacter psychrovividus]
MNPKSFNKILIANRGEIARRIIRTCHRLGINTVAVFSEADKHEAFVYEAKEAVALGGNRPDESYLRQELIIEAAQKTNAQAIHPGFGFLSENTDFAAKCEAAGITFIGPNAEAIRLMGDKKTAKQLMAENGVPVVPGYNGDDQSLEAFIREAREIGYPVLLKATAGGGGKGMRVVNSEEEMSDAFDAAKREAKSAFGNDLMLLEKYFASSRHIEFQIFGDQHGQAIHLYERDCSIQRRHQKIIEESPSPALNEVTRARMGGVAVKAAEALNYDNAGTVEFLFAEDNSFYFLEVNTRLQVEHPVTEMITGLDLVEWQIRIAQGEKLPMEQAEIPQQGHALEVRVYAEDPSNNFLPQTGKILKFDYHQHPQVRVDAGVETGSEVSIYYDPMIAKVITHSATRAENLRLMHYTLEQTALIGVNNNIDFLKGIMRHEVFQSGEFDTQFLVKYQVESQPSTTLTEEALCVTLIYEWLERSKKQPYFRHIPSGWRNNLSMLQQITYKIAGSSTNIAYKRTKTDTLECEFNDKQFTTEIIKQAGDSWIIQINGTIRKWQIFPSKTGYFIYTPTEGTVKVDTVPRYPTSQASKSDDAYTSPMPGQIIKVMVKAGDEIKTGDPLLVLSSMKMENTIYAHSEGIIEEVFVKADDMVESDKVFLTIKS